MYPRTGTEEGVVDKTQCLGIRQPSSLPSERPFTRFRHLWDIVRVRFETRIREDLSRASFPRTMSVYRSEPHKRSNSES